MGWSFATPMTNPTLVSTRRCQDKRHCFQDECERPSTPRISICLFIVETCLFRVCSTKITRASIFRISLDYQSTSVHRNILRATHPSALAFYQKTLRSHDPPPPKRLLKSGWRIPGASREHLQLSFHPPCKRMHGAENKKYFHPWYIQRPLLFRQSVPRNLWKFDFGKEKRVHTCVGI